jgi:glutamate N-acetyltransferase/amino-acid N-acetyltransferase
MRYTGRDDLCLLELTTTGQAAAVFTQNRFCAAPVVVAKQHLALGSVRYLLINAGNANAGTGAPGEQAARASCALVAEQVGCAPEAVLPFSTGVIGEDLSLTPIQAALPGLCAELAPNAWASAAASIMTTDTRPKLCSCTLTLADQTVTVTGMAKGSGMIHPNMATMLAFIATDAQVARPVLQQMLHTATAQSFNAISVDGDTSTNDACVLLASGASEVQIQLGTPAAKQLQAAIDAVSRHLAQAIVRDGEGATKCVTIRVEQAATEQEARLVAEAIAGSPLVKTALFASDPNWGRILAAVGRAPVTRLDIQALRIWLDEVCIVSGGGRDPNYTEAAGQQVLCQDEFTIRVALHQGAAVTELLTCDLSYDYVRINADYRS